VRAKRTKAHRRKAITEPRINDRIRVPEVRLVGPAGEQVGIVRLEKALRLAADAELDLVEVAPDARPPVAKLMDYGKYKYESAQKARDARRNQGGTQLKEIRFRLKIDPHDYGTKRGHVERFLGQGDKVKVMIMFRGREQSRPEMGMKLLRKLAEDVVELGTVESVPRQDGRNMVMVLAPLKKKAPRVPTRRRNRAEGRGNAAAVRAIAIEDLIEPDSLEDLDEPVTEAPALAEGVPETVAAPESMAVPETMAVPEAAAPAASEATPLEAVTPKDTVAPEDAAAPNTAKPAAAPPKPAAPAAKPAAPRPTATSARPPAPKPAAPVAKARTGGAKPSVPAAKPKPAAAKTTPTATAEGAKAVPKARAAVTAKPGARPSAPKQTTAPTTTKEKV